MENNAEIDLNQMAQSATRASALMKTLGHKDRLMILCHLAGGEKSVGQIAELLEIPQSPLSQQSPQRPHPGTVGKNCPFTRPGRSGYRRALGHDGRSCSGYP